jgi:carboxylesterase type B
VRPSVVAYPPTSRKFLAPAATCSRGSWRWRRARPPRQADGYSGSTQYGARSIQPLAAAPFTWPLLDVDRVYQEST